MTNITKTTQITHPKKIQAIELYQKLHGHISNIARALGIERKTFYNWMESDEVFAQAIREAEMELNDDLREVLIQKAGEGSTAELIFYLKSRHPDFKESPKVLQQFNVGADKGNTITFVNFKNDPES